MGKFEGSKEKQEWKSLMVIIQGRKKAGERVGVGKPPRSVHIGRQRRPSQGFEHYERRKKYGSVLGDEIQYRGHKFKKDRKTTEKLWVIEGIEGGSS